ncbi:tetratricopeptide repeat protein [Ekhidna sp.]|uniref:tetratricopeptide repeat protein n=2 Tax=Ekhidna sp. TaxID=2608089 RepID=UPI003298492B
MSKVSVRTYFDTAQAFLNEGKLKESKNLLNEVLKAKPNHLPSLLMKGRILSMEGKYKLAIENNNQALSIFPLDINLRLQSGKLHLRINELKKARVIFDSLEQEFPAIPQIHFQSAICYRKLNRLAEAESSYKKVLHVQPKHLQSVNNLANIYQLSHRYEEAESLYDTLIRSGIRDSMVYANKASVQFKKGNENEAEKSFLEAIRLNNKNVLALYNLSLIYYSSHKQEQSYKFLEMALTIEPKNVKLLSLKALFSYSNGERKSAKQQLKTLLKEYPNEEEPHLKLARIYVEELRFESVIQLLQPLKGNELLSDETHFLLGIAYDQLQLFSAAIDQLSKLAGHPKFALRALMTIQMIYSKCGEVDKYDEMMSRVIKALNQFLEGSFGEVDVPVYNLAYYPFDHNLTTKILKKHASNFERRINPLKEELNFSYNLIDSKRIKIGYLSPNFKVHPDSQLIKDFFKYHDRDRFEVYAFSLQKNDDDMYRFIEKESDHFVDLSYCSATEAARNINQLGVQILTCLSGYNLGMRMDIPALKPTPVQTMFMGYNESTQASWIDYVFGDCVTITEETRSFFSESIIELQTSYFSNSQMIPSNKNVSKEAYGIPHDVFVYGCLNHPRKIGPQIIQTWAEILKKNSKSILWLYRINEFTEKNIKKAFVNFGIAENRVIFCGKEPFRDHIKRLTLIDLFLDTPVYNGHTTCLEALWMGIPVLTIKGNTVSSRLCASFLTSLELEQFISDDLKAYINKAVEFAKDLTILNQTKEYLEKAKGGIGIFNVEGQVRKIEAAYETIWERYLKGLKPVHLKIP